MQKTENVASERDKRVTQLGSRHSHATFVAFTGMTRREGIFMAHLRISHHHRAGGKFRLYLGIVQSIYVRS